MKPKVKNKLKKLRRQKLLKQQIKEAEEKRYGELLNSKPLEKKFVEYKPKQTRYIRGTEVANIPSKPLSAPIEVKRQERYEGDMLERELAAQKEIERKKKRIAPHYSKGPYQYITDETPIGDLGRKK